MLLQHPDGKTALIRGDVDAWAGLDPMMAQAEIENGARLFYRNADANTWGILNVREEFLKNHPDLVRACSPSTRSARKYSLAHPRRLEKALHRRHQAARRGGRQAAQGAHRPHQRQRSARRSANPSSQAGLALQQAGVMTADVDVTSSDALIDLIAPPRIRDGEQTDLLPRPAMRGEGLLALAFDGRWYVPCST